MGWADQGGAGAVRECARKRSKTAESEDQNQREEQRKRMLCGGGCDRFVSACVMVI